MTARLLTLCLFLLLPAGALAHFDMPPLPPPDEYGNVLIDRLSAKNRMRPVTFSHWSHRKRFTCRVCHTEIEFAMKRNASGITENANRNGKFCGACHDGQTAFRPADNCEKCHSGTVQYGKEKFDAFFSMPVSTTPFGNGINWVAMLEEKHIKPANYLRKAPQAMKYDKQFSLEAEWSIIAPAVFPHKEHTAWLDCSSCHPEPFNIKKKTTKHFSMGAMLQGEFCGICHLKVAFPLDDCRRCHPDMKEVGF
jgi:c(7)-type cytochrome triheme protein